MNKKILATAYWNFFHIEIYEDETVKYREKESRVGEECIPIPVVHCIYDWIDSDRSVALQHYLIQKLPKRV